MRKCCFGDDSLPDSFRPYAEDTWELLSTAGRRALHAFGMALKLEDPQHFVKTLEHYDLCTLRFLRYPVSLKTDALPCGEHTDFGAVTVLLVEDQVGGLEVRSKEGEWIPVPGKQGAVLLNTGAMLARCRMSSNVTDVIDVHLI